MVTAYFENNYLDILASLWEKVEAEVVARGDFNEFMGSDNNNDFNDIGVFQGAFTLRKHHN